MMPIDFHKAKENFYNSRINEKFFQALDFVFKGLGFTGLGVWIASVLQIMYVPVLFHFLTVFALLWAQHEYLKSGKDTKASVVYYLFCFWMGVALYGSLYFYSLILTPQVVVSTVVTSLLGCACLMMLSLSVFAYRSNAEIAEKWMPTIYEYSFYIIMASLVTLMFINPMNFTGLMFINGLITVGVFSVLLVLDTFRAAYFDEVEHPLSMATVIYLDILNIVLGVLNLKSGSSEKIDYNNLMVSAFGFVLPICLGIYLVYDALFGKGSLTDPLFPKNSGDHSGYLKGQGLREVDEHSEFEPLNNEYGLRQSELNHHR